MARLHLFGGEKGGTGKSLVARTAAQYHLDRGIEFSLFDAGNSVADVKRTYFSTGCGSVIFSENKERQDEPNCLYSSARKKTTLVNLPPQVGIPLRGWLERNNLVNRAKDDGVGITYWFVCSGEPASVRMLDEHLRYFRGSINHVLAKNLIHHNTWEFLDENQALWQKIKDYEVKVIDFPRFMGKKCLEIINVKGLNFGEAREFEEFTFIDQERINNFLKKSYQGFEGVKAFDGKADIADKEDAIDE